MPMTAEQMESAYVDPSTGSIKRRLLKRLLNNVVAVGPSARPAPPAPPSQAEQQAAAEHEAEVGRRHRETIEAELAALDRHASDVGARIEALEGASIPTFALQEFRRERRMLLELRAMLAEDLDHPIMVDRDGHALTARDRKIAAARAGELRESKWAAATRAAGEGDHRRARMLRVDSLRSRQIAEMELHWRPAVAGYGSVMAWS